MKQVDVSSVFGGASGLPDHLDPAHPISPWFCYPASAATAFMAARIPVASRYPAIKLAQRAAQAAVGGTTATLVNPLCYAAREP